MIFVSFPPPLPFSHGPFHSLGLSVCHVFNLASESLHCIFGIPVFVYVCVRGYLSWGDNEKERREKSGGMTTGKGVKTSTN